MSSELKNTLNKVLPENNKLEKPEREEKIDRCKSLLLKLAQDKTLDIIISFEGTKQPDFEKNEQDLVLLEKTHLVKRRIKYTHRNVYHEYKLTEKGAELAEKLSKENQNARL
jgi:hypothetical protein